MRSEERTNGGGGGNGGSRRESDVRRGARSEDPRKSLAACTEEMRPTRITLI